MKKQIAIEICREEVVDFYCAGYPATHWAYRFKILELASDGIVDDVLFDSTGYLPAFRSKTRVLESAREHFRDMTGRARCSALFGV